MAPAAGLRQKISPEEMFLTRGENLLACKQEETTRNKRYKSTDRSELAIANRQSLRARTNLGSSSAANMIDERNGASGGLEAKNISGGDVFNERGEFVSL